MTIQKCVRVHLTVFAGCCLIYQSPSAIAEKTSEAQLTAEGEQLAAGYTAMLEKLSNELVASLPSIDGQKKQAFLDARSELSGLTKPADDATGQAHQAYEAAKANAETKVLGATRVILADFEGFLSSSNLDAKLMRIAILRDGTPRGLAEFAQQGAVEKTLLDNLLADDALMKQVLIAGGANGGEYGEAMQVYAAILEASERARKPGIFQNLALGTALHQPWIEGKDPGSVNGIVYTDHTNPDGQVERYLHYEKAYLNEELDPAFKDFNAWECRFITNDPYTNEELAWAREMLRNFRPDHITKSDPSWRYVGLVKSDLPYCSTTTDDTLGLPQQQALALGGVCGRRAFFGRFITRAFGIPARRSTQTGHAAMSLWTPDGWVVRLGAWWSMAWCGPQGGLDFLLDSQAREFPEEYMQVLRAQWIGDALGEQDVSILHYGSGGGFWDGLAFYRKRIIVEDAALNQVEAELAMLSADEARLLGESDEILGAAKAVAIEIPEEFKQIVVDADGSITIPAVACSIPDNSNDKVVFLQSWGEGMQIHYQRLSDRPEILRYYVDAPAAGNYELTALVATVSPAQNAIFRINRRTVVDAKLPYTKGMWHESEPQTIELREGRNSIMLTFRAPNRGVSIKQLQLRPSK